MLRKRTIFIYILPLIFSFLYFYITPTYMLPGEDASILFSYVENFLKTGVISYYAGGPATEGNSDFLFFVATTFLQKMGWPTYSATLLITAIALFLSSYGIFAIAATRKVWVNFFAVCSIYFSVQIWAGLLGYGTILFGMFYIWMLWAFTKNNSRILFFNATMLCIDRADGIIYAAPLLIIYLFLHRATLLKHIRMLFIWTILPFGIYFLWRWQYFDMLLPLPYYIKSRGEKFLILFNKESYYHNQHYLLYFLMYAIVPILIMIFYPLKKLINRYLIIFVIGILIPFLCYSTLVMEMNLAFRYQYPMYLTLVILLIILAKEKFSLIATICLGFFVFKTFQKSTDQGIGALQSKYNNMYSLGEKLSRIETASMALTESGVLAWKSKWKCYDMWGLNTAEFTKSLIQIENIEAIHPTIINIHAAEEKYDYLFISNQKYNQKTWQGLCYNAFNAGKNMGYEIWMIPYDTRAYKNELPPLEPIQRIYFNLVNRNQNYKRYDMFMVNKKDIKYSQIIEVFKQSGAISYGDFKTKQLKH
jgi:hypothetical protein